MNSRPISLIIVVFFLLAGCAQVTPALPPPGATATATLAPTSTPTPRPTSTPVPTATRTPTPTFEPAPVVSPELIDSTLRAEGYKRSPFYLSTGEEAYFWDNGSGISFYTYPDGIEMTMLNDPNNLPLRLEMIDEGIDTIAPFFAPGAVVALRQEAHAYADRTLTVSGDPEILDYGEEPWLGKLMEFNAHRASVRNGGNELPVYFRLLYREYKCDMTRYLYCYYIEMPSMTFTGGDTLTVFNVWIGYE